MLLYTSFIISFLSFSHSSPQVAGQLEPNPWKDDFPRVPYQTCLAEFKENSEFVPELKLWERKTNCERVVAEGSQSKICVCYAIAKKNCKMKQFPREYNCDSLPKPQKGPSPSFGDGKRTRITKPVASTKPIVTNLLSTKQGHSSTSKLLVTQPMRQNPTAEPIGGIGNQVQQSRDQDYKFTLKLLSTKQMKLNFTLEPVVTKPMPQLNRNFTSKLLFTISPTPKPVSTLPMSQSIGRNLTPNFLFTPAPKATLEPAFTKPISQPNNINFTSNLQFTISHNVTPKPVVTLPIFQFNNITFTTKLLFSISPSPKPVSTLPMSQSTGRNLIPNFLFTPAPKATPEPAVTKPKSRPNNINFTSNLQFTISHNVTPKPVVTLPIFQSNNRTFTSKLLFTLSSKFTTKPVATTPISQSIGRNFTSKLLITISKVTPEPVLTKSISQSINRNFTSKLLFTLLPVSITSEPVAKPISQPINRNFTSKLLFTLLPSITSEPVAKPTPQPTNRNSTSKLVSSISPKGAPENFTKPMSQSVNRHFTSKLLFTLLPESSSKPVVTKPMSQSVNRNFTSKLLFTLLPESSSKPVVTKPMLQPTNRNFTSKLVFTISPWFTSEPVTKSTAKSTTRGHSLTSTEKKRGQMASSTATAIPQHILDSILIYDDVPTLELTEELNQAVDKKRKINPVKESIHLNNREPQSVNANTSTDNPSGSSTFAVKSVTTFPAKNLNTESIQSSLATATAKVLRLPEEQEEKYYSFEYDYYGNDDKDAKPTPEQE